MIVTDAPGLEFQHPAQETWHAVPFIPGGIIMNVGDVLDRLTSGRFVSAYHRARNHSSKDYLLTLPFFYGSHANIADLPIRPSLIRRHELNAGRTPRLPVSSTDKSSIQSF